MAKAPENGFSFIDKQNDVTLQQITGQHTSCWRLLR